MKLGVSFNIFSGAEFLKPALLNIREFAFHVVGVYSLISNSGTCAPNYLRPLLFQLKKEGLFDELVLHEFQPIPVPVGMSILNKQKYVLGHNACVKKGCTHFMLRDCDEFYEKKLFEKQLGNFEQFDCTVSHIIEYFHKPSNRARQLSGLSVVGVHKIDLHYNCRRNNPFGILVDSERTPYQVKNFKIFKVEELLMHHFTAVRFNRREFLRKYEGHSHFMREGSIDEYTKRIDNISEKQLVEVDDIFGIQSYWDNEFVEVYEQYT